MEKILVLKAEVRDKTGSSSAVSVRKAGRIPAIIYGHKKEPVAISLDAHNLVKGIHQGSRVLEIEIDGKKETMIFKDLQYDYLGKYIIHVDLMRVDASETIKVAVAIELRGIAKGTHEGGIIEEHMDRLEIECKVVDIPESIIVSVKEVGVGDNIHAGDIELPAGLKLVSDAGALVITCSLVAAAVSAAGEVGEGEEEEPTAPEVIGEKKEDEESK